MPKTTFNINDLSGIGADRDDILASFRISSHLHVEDSFHDTAIKLNIDGHLSSKHDTDGHAHVVPCARAPFVSLGSDDDAREARYREDSPTSFDENISSNSSWASSPSTWSPLERFCKERERHERIALMMIFMSNCKGIYSSSAQPNQTTHQYKSAPEAPASTRVTISDEEDGYQEHLDEDHPLGRYFAQIEEHELLAYECRELGHQPSAVADIPTDDRYIQPEPESAATSPNPQRDVTPLSVDTPSTISLHPSGPAAQPTNPRKRNADAIEASDDFHDETGQNDELLSEIRQSLAAANCGRGKPRIARQPRFRRRLAYELNRRHAG